MFEPTVAFLLPDLERAFFLENTHHDGRTRTHVVRFHLVDGFLRERVFNLVGDRIKRIIAAGQRQHDYCQKSDWS